MKLSGGSTGDRELSSLWLTRYLMILKILMTIRMMILMMNLMMILTMNLMILDLDSLNNQIFTDDGADSDTLAIDEHVAAIAASTKVDIVWVGCSALRICYFTFICLYIHIVASVTFATNS